MKVVQALILLIASCHLISCVPPAPIEKPPALDTDKDGQPDDIDVDDDNDGIADLNDKFPLDPKERSDNDGDFIGDNADLDDDNDGAADIADKFPLDATENKDFDGDGVGDNADLDDDNDGTPDLADLFPLDPTEQLDTDQDGTGNNADLDDDNDNTPDLADKFPLDANEQGDFDSDNTGDNADLDDDNDGTADLADAFPFNAKEQKDFDRDGLGDIADLDDDNDNTSDLVDKFPFDATEQKDFDVDGIGNNADVDDDNDEIADSIDTFLSFSTEILPITENAILLSALPYNRLFIIQPNSRRMESIDLTNGELLNIRRLANRPVAAALNPDGSTLFVALSDTTTGKGSVVAYNTQTLDIKSTFNIDVSPFSLVATSDDKVVVSAQNYLSPMTLIDAKLQTIQQIPPYFPFTTHLTMDPQDRWIYASPTDSLYPVFTFNIVNNSPLSSPQLTTKAKHLWPAPDGKSIFINTHNNEFEWIPVGDGAVNAPLIKTPDFDQPVRDVAFDPQAPIAAIVMNDSSIHLLNLQTMEVFKSLPANGTIHKLAFQEDALIRIETDPSDIYYFTKEQHPCPRCKSNGAPVARLTVDPQEGNVNQAINFDASTSTDPEKEPLVYRWDFNGDQIWDTEFTSSPSISHTYITPGTYEVSVQIKDAFTQRASASKKIEIQPVFQPGTPIEPGTANSFAFSAQNGYFDGKSTAYYIDPQSKKLYLVDLFNGQATHFFTTLAAPKQIIPSLDKNSLYILQSGEAGESFISTIDLHTQQLTASIKLTTKAQRLVDGNYGHWIVINTDGSMSYVEKNTGAVTYTDRFFLRSEEVAFTSPNLQGDKFYLLGSYGVQAVSTNPEEASWGPEEIAFNKPYFFNALIKHSWFTPDGTIIISDTGLIHNLDRKEIYPFFEGSRINNAQIDDKKKLLFTLNNDGRLYIYNLNTFQLIESYSPGSEPIDIIVTNNRLFVVNAAANGGSTLTELPYPNYDCSNLLPAQVTLRNLSALNKIGTALSLQAQASTDDQADQLLYRWDLNGDGRWDTQFDSNSSRSQTFLAPGTHTFTVQVRNRLGATSTASITLDLANTDIRNVPILDEPISNNLFPHIKQASSLLLPNSNILAISDQQTNYLYFVDTNSSKVIKSLYTDYPPGSLSISPSGNTLFVMFYEYHPESFSYTIRIGRIDLKTFTLSNVIDISPADEIQPLSDTQIVTGQSRGEKLTIIDATSGNILTQASSKRDGSIKLIDNGQGVLVDRAQYYRIENGEFNLIVNNFNPFPFWKWVIPGDKWILDHEFNLTEIPSLTTNRRLEILQDANITSAIFSADGKLGFLTLSNKNLLVLDTQTLEIKETTPNWDGNLIGYQGNALIELNYSEYNSVLSLRKRPYTCISCASDGAPSTTP
jgi:6-phosphogluconolactonase (cycloisomerase 2 family)